MRQPSADRPRGHATALLTRRNLLERATWAIAAVALPRTANAAQDAGSANAGPSISPMMATLSTYMSEARDRALPADVVEKAKQHVLDTLAAMVSGSELPPGREAIRFARAYGGEKVATVVASDVCCGPIEAAIANAELAHSDETDDYDPGNSGHPGSSIVPAALALGEQFGISGAHFLRAVMLGYDLGLRMVNVVGAGTSVRDIHDMVGTFGAAAAGACAAGLEPQQMRWVLDYAAQQAASGIEAWKRDTEHIEKGFVFAGAGARNGVTAALLVQSGWTGVNDILSGPNNFLQSYAPQADPDKLIEGLGERYEVAEVNIKKWSVGGPVQPALDAMENLLKRHPVKPDQVRQVIVRLATRGAATVNNREMPDICLQRLIAVMLIDKTVSFRAAHDRPRMQDPAILRERAKVQLIPSDEFERLNPRRVAVVELTLKNGTEWSERVDAVRGTFENPMTRDEVAAKARDLMTPVLGQEASAKLIEQTLGLDRTKDVRGLRPLLQRA